MKTFYQLITNSLISNTTTFIVWSTVIYWSYLETGSVLAISIISGTYLVLVMLSGIWFGSIVDHHNKKNVLLYSTTATLLFFLAAFFVYISSPEGAFKSISSVHLWGVNLLLLFGVIAGNIRGITIPTMITYLVPEEKRANANGVSGTVFGITFAISNVAAGLGYGFFGMYWILVFGMGCTTLAILHLFLLKIEEPQRVADEQQEVKDKRIDIRGTIKAVKEVPGLFALIFFTTFNNFLGGIFMSLMDPYGLSLVSVKVWGTLWGFLSLGFIVGGLVIAKRGVGKNPVRTIFNVNMLIWSTCIFMTIQPSIVLLAVCMAIYLCFVPFIEASEQTVIQKVVPQERQGRVFGFAQSVEQAASPITAFMIGPIAQFIFIPFMTTGKGVTWIGDWYGVGEGRGIGLVFTCAGIIGLIVTYLARQSKASHNLTYAFQVESKQ